jgi:hypothetical protein
MRPVLPLELFLLCSQQHAPIEPYLIACILFVTAIALRLGFGSNFDASKLEFAMLFATSLHQSLGRMIHGS